jgi:hypothetical protein
VRIYCTYDDAAVEADSQDEKPLSFDPFYGDWELSLPCKTEDLAWVKAALRKKTSRIVAREESDGVSVDHSRAQVAVLEVNLEEFSKS